MKFEGRIKHKSAEISKLKMINQFRNVLMKILNTKNKYFQLNNQVNNSSVSFNAEENCTKVLEKSDIITPDLVIYFKKKAIRPK